MKFVLSDFKNIREIVETEKTVWYYENAVREISELKKIFKNIRPNQFLIRLMYVSKNKEESTMKKSIKKILCAILAMTVVFGSLTAFAADGEPIYSPDGSEVPFAGELKEGSNTVSNSDGNECIYVTFDAEKDGYYVFSYETEVDCWITHIELDESRKITYSDDMGDEFMLYNFDGGESFTLHTFFELKAGENILIISWDSKIAAEETIDVSYLGNEITGVDFSAGSDYTLTASDLYEVYYELVDAEYQYGFSTDDFVLTFDTGKTFETDSARVYFESETIITEGVYDIGVYLGKKTVPAQIEVRLITCFVENAEADNPEDFIIAEYYDGTQEFVPYEGTFTVTLKNGEKIKVNEEWENVVIPGTDPDGYSLYAKENDEEKTVEIRLAGYVFEKYECKTQKATTEQNFNHMKEKITDTFNNSKYVTDYFYEIMVNSDSKADTLRAFGTLISHISNSLIPVLGNIIGEFFEFVGYEISHL